MLSSSSSSSSKRRTERIVLPSGSIGARYEVLVHRYGPPDNSSVQTQQCYIQASLHADELPGLLVCHHLIHLLDEAEARGDVLQRIVIVPFANPIGLSQTVLGTHIGRFSTETGVNFNRNWPDVTDAVSSKLEKELAAKTINLQEGDTPEAARENVNIIRQAILAEIDAKASTNTETELKRRLLRIAAVSDISLDLHCDSDAILHMYTHDRLWPAMTDLACELESHCQLLASISGGNPMDETASGVWASLQERFPQFPIPMACQSVTVELRGEMDVQDDLAIKDATAIFRFLQRRGYLRGGEAAGPLPALLKDATSLSAVDMVEAQSAGLIIWKTHLGQHVEANQVLAEIVNVEDPDAPREQVVSKTSGIVFGRRRHRLSRPGQIVVKVAGDKVLDWRSGMLLTSR